MKTIRIIISFTSLTAAVLILAISLLVSSQEVVAQTGEESSIYFSGNILPDHSLYPLLMVIDRVHLLKADDDELLELYVSYSFDRLYAAQSLLEKGKTNLAVSTITKSQKYLILATVYLEEHGSPPDKKAYVLSALREHQKLCKTLHQKLPPEGAHVVSELGNETNAWITKLSS